MRRTQIYLDEEQADLLATRAAAEGTTLSALIRQAIDALIAGGNHAQRLKSFRAAVAASAGSAPDLPPGAEYVADLRERDAVRERELWGAEL